VWVEQGSGRQGDLGPPSCGRDGEEEKGAATTRGWHRWRCLIDAIGGRHLRVPVSSCRRSHHDSTEGHCAEGAVAPGGPPLAWTVGAGEKEREGRESEERSREKENAGRAESMDIYRRLQTMLRCLLWHRGLRIRRTFFDAGVKGQDLNTVQIGRASLFC
jgi:hypothetical protein